jgi:alkylresorcinol/alkylpyrone synthase
VVEKPVSLIAGLATASPSEAVDVEDIWKALGQLRGRRMPRPSSEQAPGTRYLAEPLSSIMTVRSQDEQTAAYIRHAQPLSEEAACSALLAAGVSADRIGLVIFVSCTGYVLPSLDAELITRLGLRRDVDRLPIAELGCGGGLAGLSRAHDYLRAYPLRSVLLVAVEVPSLTFQPQDHSVDNLVAALVFGDGAGAAVLQAANGDRGWRVEQTATMLVPEGASHLGYRLGDGGLRVILSRELPAIVEKQLQGAVKAFLSSCETSLDDIDLVACHPGGPGIFDAVSRALSLRPAQMALSRSVFSRFGNVSSAGIFYVLQGLPSPVAPRRALAFAFGPGLSIEMALLSS